MKTYRVGEGLPMGASIVGQNAVQFVLSRTGEENQALALYDRATGKREVIPLLEDYAIGNLFSLVVEGVNPKRLAYNFIRGGEESLDPYAKVVYGNERWGIKEAVLTGGILTANIDWEGDRPLRLPLEQTILYQLHVRGFTRHSSSGVGKKGCFEGVAEKLPYLRGLGITALELMPVYEFQEWDVLREPASGTERRLNYWGFKPGSYFAPKASYSGGKHPGLSFKHMVKELHRGGIEVILQFYVEPGLPFLYLLEALRFWVQEYHVDGFRLLGEGIPVECLLSDPALINTKLFYESAGGGRETWMRRFGLYNDDFLYAVRRFLKGDVGSLRPAFEAMLPVSCPWDRAVYLSNYNSFTMKDMVSYDRKHNEANGENNRDGSSNNLSWNCGMEGRTSRKAVLALRKKQLKNAFALLLFSRGIPVILAGDEFGHSREGNNNPYCQDNRLSWLNWKDGEKEGELQAYVKDLIALRKSYGFLGKWPENPGERKGPEHPFLSFHGKEAWKPVWENGHEEAGGILFCDERQYLYFCINMHWQETSLALPNLPDKLRWRLILDTDSEGVKEGLEDRKQIRMEPRSIKLIAAEGGRRCNDEDCTAF